MDERDVIMLYIQVGGALLVSAITGVMGALVREVWALRKERQEKPSRKKLNGADAERR